MRIFFVIYCALLLSVASFCQTPQQLEAARVHLPNGWSLRPAGKQNIDRLFWYLRVAEVNVPQTLSGCSAHRHRAKANRAAFDALDVRHHGVSRCRSKNCQTVAAVSNPPSEFAFGHSCPQPLML